MVTGDGDVSVRVCYPKSPPSLPTPRVEAAGEERGRGVGSEQTDLEPIVGRGRGREPDEQNREEEHDC